MRGQHAFLESCTRAPDSRLGILSAGYTPADRQTRKRTLEAMAQIVLDPMYPAQIACVGDL